MAKKVFLTFVVPLYNIEKYISKTLNSLLVQTCKEFEIVIVDDGSTDNTYAVASDILKNSDFENYKIIQKENSGVSSARNVGIKEAQGKYVIFLDGDDYVSPNLVARLKEVTEKDQWEMICWKFQKVTEEGKLSGSQFNQEGLNEGKVYAGIDILEKILIERKFWVCTGSAAYLRSLLLEKSLYYDEKYHSGEDQNFTYKYLANVKHVYFIDEVLSYYVQRTGSVTYSANSKCFDAYLALMDAKEYLLINRLESYYHRILVISQALDELAVIDFIYPIHHIVKNSKLPSYRRILRLVNSRHPGLFDVVVSKARGVKKFASYLGFKRKIEFLMFGFSPRLCILLLWIYYKIVRKS
ncbi:MAG: glycosyltransferase [Fervidobacterium sp.]